MIEQMLKVDAQTPDRAKELALSGAAIAIGLCISAGFLIGERRATPRDATLFAAALVATLWPAFERLASRTFRHQTSVIVGAVHGFVASTTYELGGLAFVMPAVLFGLAGVVHWVPPRDRRALTHVGRVLTVPLALVLMVSVAGIAFVPVIFVFLVRWAWTRPTAVARAAFGFFAGITGVYTATIAILSVVSGYVQFLVFEIPVIVAIVLSVRHGWFRGAARNRAGIGGVTSGVTLTLLAFALLWWWPVWR